MVTLEKGKFYAKPGGGIYYYDGYYLRSPRGPGALSPTLDPHHGLSSFHDGEVDVRKFEEVDPLKYLEREKKFLKKSLEQLTKFIKEYS